MKRAVLLMVLGVTALAQPRIDAVTPGQGPIAGGTAVTLTGSGFTGATVRLDRSVLVPLALSDGEIRLMMPRHDNGPAVISVRSGNASAAREFLYVPPALDAIAPGFVTTIAGIGFYSRDFGLAAEATVTPCGVLADRASGDLYFAQPGLGTIARVRSDGTIERIAGGGGGSEPGDGKPALDAQIAFPQSLARDGAGNLYIPDHTYRIRRVDAATGIITTIAGDGVRGFSGDGGPATAARIGVSTFIVADAADVFILDFDNTRIRRIHLADGTISTFAGNGTPGFSGDNGPATAAQFDLGDSDEGHLALDRAGHLFLADSANGRIRRIDRQSGIITTFARPGTTFDPPGGVGFIRSLAIDDAGNVYYGGSGRIVQLDPNGNYVRSWGKGVYGLSPDGTALADAHVSHVVGLAIDGAGNIVYSDDAIGRLRRLNLASGKLETVAGIGPSIIGENGPAIAAAAVMGNADLAMSTSGNLLIGDGSTLRIRELGRDGVLRTIAGTGSFIGGSDHVPATQAVIHPIGLEVAPDGSMDLAQASDVVHIDAGGFLTRIAGRDPNCSYEGDGGPASQSKLCQPWGTVRDGDGNLFIADTNNNRIRRVDAATGVITTFAGNGGPVSGFERYYSGTFCGDGGPALQSCLNNPSALRFDGEGALYVGDYGNRRVRRIDRSGIITTFADGAALTRLAIDSVGRLYGHGGNHIFRIERDGTFAPIAGTGEFGFGGDGGPAMAASLHGAPQSNGVAIDAGGNLYFADGANGRVRAIRYGAVLAPAGATAAAIGSGSVIRVTVRDGSGRPAPGVRVDFTAPSGGASCSLARTFAITDRDGVASVVCTANCFAGSYPVTAQPVGTSSAATVTRTNAAGPCRRRAARH